MSRDLQMQDADAAEEEKLQYIHADDDLEELNEKFPNRPHNHSKSLPFHDLFQTLFDPLLANRKKPAGPAAIARRRAGPNGPQHMTPNEQRHVIIERFMSKWRQKVGQDFYPAMRLILPDKDRDRPMYGLKEKTIARLLIKAMLIDKNSEDALALLNWKLPGGKTSSSAGDFAARCLEIISKRPIRTAVGNLTIGQVNIMLDKLSTLSKEEDQLSVFNDFYRQMNAEEMTWLIRIILRQMKVGATEKTFLNIWHRDAETLFNVSSSLRRVCWELFDPAISLQQDQSEITLMQCFLPQLAAFQLHSFEKIVKRMNLITPQDEFWIEEKMDGERIQLHMIEDPSHPGGFRFAFWSRKAKDYTYLYGDGFEDEESALTQHLKTCFVEDVRNIILDGEMITWDMEMDKIVPFGTLKSAALSEKRNPYAGKQRPLLRVFDCLYLNDTALTKQPLFKRREALEKAVRDVPRRLEKHPYVAGNDKIAIENELRRVVAEASEGLVVKNIRSVYRHERNEDWIKVKPEYMTEYGEDLDCIIIGGYYGSGRRGGGLSSFLCGLREDRGDNPQRCLSFFKVGGGLNASDYQEIRDLTEGKWIDWDSKNPPSDFIQLAGGTKQHEKPDVWIKPENSVVVAVKAASAGHTDRFATAVTLRFPRFKALRKDKNWQSALSVEGFKQLKQTVEQEHNERKFELDEHRKLKRKTTTRKTKKPLRVLGDDDVPVNKFAGPDTSIFQGLTFFVLGPATQPKKASKAELEKIIKTNGGNIVQTHQGHEKLICISETRNLKAATIQKEEKFNIVRPSWIFDCIEIAKIDEGRPPFLLPYEPSHMFYTLPSDVAAIASNVDEFGDSYCRDLTVQSLRKIMDAMPEPKKSSKNFDFIAQLESHGIDVEDLPGVMFRNLVAYFDDPDDIDNSHARRIFTFGNGTVATDLGNEAITHVVVGRNSKNVGDLRESISRMSRPIPRVTTIDWILESWKEKTLLDAERLPAN